LLLLRVPAAALVAVDMGAVPALALAASHPDRVCGTVHLLAADYCRSITPSDGFARTVRDAFLQFTPLSSPFLHIFAKFLRLTTLAMPPGSLKNAQMQGLAAESPDSLMMERMSGDLMLACAQASMDGSATGVQHDLCVQLGSADRWAAALPQIKQEVSLVAGGKDLVVPASVPHALTGLLPRSCLEMHSENGHLSTIASGLVAALQRHATTL
jgi:pimeloyl-ACP methyl ester carboxylesterase